MIDFLKDNSQQLTGGVLEISDSLPGSRMVVRRGRIVGIEWEDMTPRIALSRVRRFNTNFRLWMNDTESLVFGLRPGGSVREGRGKRKFCISWDGSPSCCVVYPSGVEPDHYPIMI